MNKTHTTLEVIKQFKRENNVFKGTIIMIFDFSGERLGFKRATLFDFRG